MDFYSLIGSLGHVDESFSSEGLGARGCVDCVTEKAEPRHSFSDDPRDDLTRIDAGSYLQRESNLFFEARSWELHGIC